MNNLMPSNDLGKFQIADYAEKIVINELISTVTQQIKKSLLEVNLEAHGYRLNLTITKTGFGGMRYWFICPMCTQRKGVIYKQPQSEVIGCRQCLKLKYKKQRYKGMIEYSS